MGKGFTFQVCLLIHSAPMDTRRSRRKTWIRDEVNAITARVTRQRNRLPLLNNSMSSIIRRRAEKVDDIGNRLGHFEQLFHIQTPIDASVADYFLKTSWQKEKLLIMSNSFFCQNVFHHIQ